MKTEDFAKIGLSEEMAGKCAEAVAETLKGYVPKSRLDEVIAERDRYKQIVTDREAQIADISKKLKADGDTEKTITDLKTQIDKLTEDNKAAQAKYESETKRLKIDKAAESAIFAAKARNVGVVKSTIAEFLDTAELDENGNVKGLTDHLKKMAAAADTRFLFEAGAAISGGHVPPEGVPAKGQPAATPTWAEAIKSRMNKGE